MRLLDRVKGETSGIEARDDEAGFDQFGGLLQDLAVMRTALTGQQRQQRELARVRRGSE